jgi:ubiquitin C-terminal hydrolase
MTSFFVEPFSAKWGGHFRAMFHPLAAGLPNLGNTCWLSAAAMFLTQLPVTLWRRTGKHSHQLLQMLRTLHDARLSNQHPRDFDRGWTGTLLATVAEAGISEGYGSALQQHDPAELVEYVISTLLMEDHATKFGVKELLGRSVCSITQCQECSKTLARESQPEFLLHLTVPDGRGPVTLSECITAARRAEVITGACDCTVGESVTLLRCSYEERLPPTVIVLLRRTSADGRKLRTPVKVPSDLSLTLKRVDAAREINRYELHGVIQHQGEAISSGHYVYHGAGGALWHSYNDETVTTTTRLGSNRIDRDAVLLLYQQVS